MLGLAFHYDATEFDRWVHLVDAYCVDKVFVFELPSNCVVTQWACWSGDSLDLPATRVLVAPKQGRHQRGRVELEEFIHPRDAVYIFGSDHVHNLEMPHDESLHIEMPRELRVLYASQAALLVLNARLRHGYHR